MKVISKLIVCLILVVGISFGLLSDSASAALFTKSCRDTNLNGATLSSSCKDRSGNYKSTSIGLNPFIGNSDGVLQWGSQNFSNTCEGIRLEGAGALFANCKRRNGSSNNTSINLDDRISNNNGNLTFDR
ncbi:MAG: CVNH domain-containing protein [Prochloraceae cyanobacterium]|nr:CVNH domain-containing protein [Prochloraceae cyanobacterium]